MAESLTSAAKPLDTLPTTAAQSVAAAKAPLNTRSLASLETLTDRPQYEWYFLAEGRVAPERKGRWQGELAGGLQGHQPGGQ